jgi:hypothetical protein
MRQPPACAGIPQSFNPNRRRRCPHAFLSFAPCFIGGIGVSGVLASQDEMVAKASLDTLTAR